MVISYPSNNFLTGFTDAMGRTTVFDFHLLAVNSGWGEVMQTVASSFIDGNKLGTYDAGRQIVVRTQVERHAQTDGNLYRKGTTFRFRVLSKALKMWY